MKPGKEFKLLCLFDFNCATGFATVSHNIVQRLRRYFGERLIMDIVAINYIYNDADGKAQPGKPYYLDSPFNRQAVMPAIQETASVVDPLGRHEFLRLLRAHDYNIVFVIQDPGVMAGRIDDDGTKKGDLFAEMKKIKAEKKAANRKQFKFIFYFPVDGEPLEEWFDNFDVVDSAIAYTEYGKEEVLAVRPDMKTRLRVIPHGNNRKDFYPLADTDETDHYREYYFGKNASKNIWGNINRNQTRKDIPSTIFAFEKYLRSFDNNAFLYLHMLPTDPQGWKLRQIFAQTSLVEGQDFMFQQRESRDIGTEELNKIYNSLDYFITTTTGEGWGLTITEAMACGVPVLAPYHTSIKDISGGMNVRCWTTQDLRLYVSHFDNMIREAVDYNTLPILMDIIAKHPEKSSEKTYAAMRYIESLDWDIVCQKWIFEFERLI